LFTASQANVVVVGRVVVVVVVVVVVGVVGPISQNWPV